MHKRLTVPCDRHGTRLIVVAPWRAAVSFAVVRAVIWEGGMLRRRMKPDVSNVHSRSNRHSERLDGAIEILVIERVLIVPDTG